MHAQFFHSSQYSLLQLLLLFVPTIRVRPSPSLQVIHLPPRKEGRTRNETIDFLLAIPQPCQHVSPHTFVPHSSQRHIDAMQRHPVYFLLPTLPIPKRHRIREGAIIEIIAQSKVRFMPFRLLHCWQMLRQLRMHLIPSQMNACMIFQIPIDTHSNVHVCVAFHHHLVALLAQLEKVLLTFH